VWVSYDFNFVSFFSLPNFPLLLTPPTPLSLRSPIFYLHPPPTTSGTDAHPGKSPTPPPPLLLGSSSSQSLSLSLSHSSSQIRRVHKLIKFELQGKNPLSSTIFPHKSVEFKVQLLPLFDFLHKFYFIFYIYKLNAQKIQR
jgi:hypothetical protein